MKRRNFIKAAALSNASIIATPSIIKGWKNISNKVKKIKVGQIRRLP